MILTQLTLSWVLVISIFKPPACSTYLVCNLSAGAQLFVSPFPIRQAEWRWPAGYFAAGGDAPGGDAAGQRCPFVFTRQPGGRRGGCNRGRQQVLLLPLRHHLPQPASRLNILYTGRSGKYKDFVWPCCFIFFPELQESYEQCFPPAEDDGDPTHEQCMPGHLAATSTRDSTGSNQRWVRLKKKKKKHKVWLFFCFVFYPKEFELFFFFTPLPVILRLTHQMVVVCLCCLQGEERRLEALVCHLSHSLHQQH